MKTVNTGINAANYPDCSSHCTVKDCKRLCYKTGKHAEHACVNGHKWPREWWEK